MNKIGNKDFDGWIIVKKDIHKMRIIHNIKRGEIWWSSVGENVGTEICGKGKTFSRPVIVFRKLDRYSFWAIPLTSKPHKGSWYVSFDFNGRDEVAVVSQIEYMSVYRLHRKIGQMSNLDFQKVYEGFCNLLVQKNTPQLVAEGWRVVPNMN